MSKIGRNATCHCGSEKKYKRCCGRSSPKVELDMNFQEKILEAQEYRRRLMQGLGKPILSYELSGKRRIRVGSEIFNAEKAQTFHEFLLFYIKHVLLTDQWERDELAKPDSERHPLISWCQKVSEHREQLVGSPKKNKIYGARTIGVIRAYLGLAYDLYLAAHNAELPALLIKRLQNKNNFEGALYEAYVIGNFAKAGFKIEMESEDTPTTSHCEFVAIHVDTGRRFSVEAKAITSKSERSGKTSKPPRIRAQLHKALSKDLEHERIIFIELSREHTMLENGQPDWLQAIDQEIEKAENELTIMGNPAPPAYVFVTNRAFMHSLDEETAYPEIGLICGFKTEGFPIKNAPSMLEAVKMRKQHIELHWLMKAISTHSTIPATFDDKLPEEVFSKEQIILPQIGKTFLVPDENGREVPGVLYDGIVIENERRAAGIFKLEDGRSIIVSMPLNSVELEIYRRSPDTFFGVLKHESRKVKDPLDMFDAVFETYSKSSRETLLKFMAEWPEIELFESLSDIELAEFYCAQVATSMWRDSLTS